MENVFDRYGLKIKSFTVICCRKPVLNLVEIRRAYAYSPFVRFIQFLRSSQDGSLRNVACLQSFGETCIVAWPCAVRLGSGLCCIFVWLWPQLSLIGVVLDYVIHSACIPLCLPPLPPLPFIVKVCLLVFITVSSVTTADSYGCCESLEGTRILNLPGYHPRHWQAAV